MPDITTYNSVTVANVMANLDLYKTNPTAMLRATYDLVDEITSGAVNIVDPTSPFVMLLESSAIGTSMAINESMALLRKQYPALAQTDADLYMHLSDVDFIDRFATPSNVTFTVVLSVNDILNKMVRVDAESCYKATIPRDSRYTINDYIFTSKYPIDIRKYDNGVVKITYDATVESKLGALASNVIDYVVRKDTNAAQWLFFTTNVDQFAIESTHFPLQKSIVFKQTIPFTDQYYYLRAFYRNNSTNHLWKEMVTTHTDQVFDPFNPTVLIEVFDSYVTVALPPVYLTSNLVSGEIRFDVYSTKGSLTLDLSNYKPDAFGLSPVAVDEERDISAYTNALNAMSYYTFSNEVITGGSNGIDFITLRDRVINNATGVIDIPITNKRIETFVGTKGFELVKNIDTVTNRIFLATQRLPKPTNLKLATSANIGISTFITNISELQALGTVRYVNNRLTILSNNLYINDNGVIKILKEADKAALNALTKTALVSEVNSKRYLYSPFYYVLDDTNQEFELRAYNLDYPLATGLSFESQNESIQLPVNTGSYSLDKTATGYKLSVITKSGNFYKQLADGLVFAQIAYTPVGESRLAYINGVMTSKDDNNERIYEFNIVTNYNINADDSLCITNASMFGNETVNTWLKLNSVFHIFYATTSVVSGFTADAANALLGKFILPPNAVAATHETLNLKLGSSLKNLWTRSRSMASGQSYKLYDVDVPMFYDKDFYETDPVTGSVITFDTSGAIQYNITHQQGDPVLNNAGEQVFKHRKGDVVLDNNGVAIIETAPGVDKEIDMLFVDGRHYFVDDAAFISYNHELVDIIDTWINNDIYEISLILLEKTYIFFYPKTTLTDVLVYIEDSGQDILSSEQSLVVNLYVKGDIYSDAAIRAKLEESTVSILDSYIGNTVINMSDVESALRAAYGASVQSLSTSGLGGSKNYRLLTLSAEENRLALKKILYQQQDNTLIIKEDVTVNFLQVK